MAALKMEYSRLGKSGLKVSKVILGGMSYGSSSWEKWVLDEEESLPLLEHAYKRGINTWDTADIYSNGRSEEIIGKALKKYHIPRERVVILTKCFFGADVAAPEGSAVSATDDERVNRKGLSRKAILDGVDASLARLGTAYIDVLQIHRLDKETPREEIMRALNDVVDSGKVRYLGASSMMAWQFQALQNVADRHGWHKFICMQNYHNLTYREEEREMIPYCLDSGVGLIPWSPIAAGLLARPWHSRETRREETDGSIALRRSRDKGADSEIVKRVEEVANRMGVPMAAVATAWSLAQPLTNPIIGLSSKERIDQACEAVKVKLSDDDMKYLEEPYQPKSIAGHS